MMEPLAQKLQPVVPTCPWLVLPTCAPTQAGCRACLAPHALASTSQSEMVMLVPWGQVFPSLLGAHISVKTHSPALIGQDESYMDGGQCTGERAERNRFISFSLGVSEIQPST